MPTPRINWERAAKTGETLDLGGGWFGELDHYDNKYWGLAYAFPKPDPDPSTWVDIYGDGFTDPILAGRDLMQKIKDFESKEV